MDEPWVHRELGSRRRALGEELLQACLGNWKKRKIVFLDVKGLATWDDCIEFVFSLLVRIGFHVLSEGGSNKWLSMWPISCDLVFMRSFHRVFFGG